MNFISQRRNHPWPSALDGQDSYLISKTTDDSRPPAATQVSQRHVVPRADWQWSAVALLPSRPPRCKSVAYAPNAWSPQNASSDIEV